MISDTRRAKYRQDIRRNSAGRHWIYCTIPDLSPGSLSAKQPAVFSLRNAVRFGGAFLESFSIPYGDVSARRRYQTAAFESVQRLRDAGPADREHQRQEVVSERQRVDAQPVVRHQDPARQALVQFGLRIADCGLRSLDHERL